LFGDDKHYSRTDLLPKPMRKLVKPQILTWKVVSGITLFMAALTFRRNGWLF
jgi:hypothetical protein